MSTYKHIVIDKEWLGDIAVQRCGSFESIIELAIENDISITEELVSGTEIGYSTITNKGLKDWFTKNKYIPATVETAVYTSNDEPVNLPGGIGFMAIQINFIIS